MHKIAICTVSSRAFANSEVRSVPMLAVDISLLQAEGDASSSCNKAVDT